MSTVLLTDTQTSITIILAIFLGVFLLWNSSSCNIPYFNPPRFWQLGKAKRDFITNGMEMIWAAKKRFPGQPFRIMCDRGEVVVLPPHMAHEIRNESSLSFSKAMQMDFFTHLPGFKPIDHIAHKGEVLQHLARRPLTKYLNRVTKPLASETTFAVNLIFGNLPVWKETLILDSSLDLVARLSTQIFLGDKLCRNEEWLRVAKEYTMDMFEGSRILSEVPGPLRYPYALFSPHLKALRSKVNRANQILQPVIEERRAFKEQERKAGRPVPVFNDALEWAEAECRNIEYDAAGLQLNLANAAIHTSSDLLAKTLLLLSNEPALIDPLREEIVRALQEYGWSKTALHYMKLLDSALKEAQRLLPTDWLVMRRIATKDIHLKKENIKIRKGQYVMVDYTTTMDSAVFKNPEKFDIYRWVRMREDPVLAHKAPLVSTSELQLGFGHGMHACPGRFFAANELKIALSYLLLNYDWEVTSGTSMKPWMFGSMPLVDPSTTLRYRRRKAEINLDTLQCET
ncbi:hypothetical protein COCMIDRAFT_10413 [Bipolaris oryzae ATCC 44560]|uniref:Cytochrome P450 monooxygenase n=1 Tax=Bipolaris oryzae ATCC 44560 TaxID=930090 RepID=W6YPQ4_COCMI|nr:uncharacterized protein COCMIDRAFT_10413 [Bipolaris oryzae ATCC 44560]EUC39498.1 hypothetical protein COCMIDRAFT_10413 [Bipolaris oryzae ATCC 44560]